MAKKYRQLGAIGVTAHGETNVEHHQHQRNGIKLWHQLWRSAWRVSAKKHGKASAKALEMAYQRNDVSENGENGAGVALAAGIGGES
jgi:hypothetical protein